MSRRLRQSEKLLASSDFHQFSEILLDANLFLIYSESMTYSYRSPHQTKGPSGYEPGGPRHFTVNAPPAPRPLEACGVEWLMGHVVDVIAAGPMYGDTLSPVWAQMVRLYAQYLGVIPTRAARRDDRSPRRQALEKDLRALVPAIADLIEAHEAGEAAPEAEAGEAEEAAQPPSPEENTPDPSDLALAEAFELEPITRLADDGVMRAALGFRPTLDSLNRVLQLALDASMHRARILRGPMAEISPKAEAHIDRLTQRWLNWFPKKSDPGEQTAAPPPASPHADQPESELPDDYFYPSPRASPN
jgi:hypothetical protein